MSTHGQAHVAAQEWDMTLAIINDKKLGCDRAISKALQAVHDAFGRDTEVERIPCAPAKHIQRGWHSFLGPVSETLAHDHAA